MDSQACAPGGEICVLKKRECVNGNTLTRSDSQHTQAHLCTHVHTSARTHTPQVSESYKSRLDSEKLKPGSSWGLVGAAGGCLLSLRPLLPIPKQASRGEGLSGNGAALRLHMLGHVPEAREPVRTAAWACPEEALEHRERLGTPPPSPTPTPSREGVCWGGGGRLREEWEACSGRM